MEYIAIGCDISKGRCDVVIINQSGTVLTGSGGYDDVRRDHERLRATLMDLREQYPQARILVGLESTGGLERNWLAFFRTESRGASRTFPICPSMIIENARNTVGTVLRTWRTQLDSNQWPTA